MRPLWIFLVSKIRIFDEIIKKNEVDGDSESIRKDWELTGKDFEEAIKEFELEIDE